MRTMTMTDGDPTLLEVVVVVQKVHIARQLRNYWQKLEC